MQPTKDQLPTFHSTVNHVGNPTYAILGEAGQVAIRKNGSSWEFNLWNNEGWQTCPSQTVYIPPISVRGIYLHRISGEITYTDAVLVFDEFGYGDQWGSSATVDSAYPAYRSGIRNTLTTRVLHTKRIISIDLANSTFTEAYLSA
jgi:hypothetical protein